MNAHRKSPKLRVTAALVAAACLAAAGIRAVRDRVPPRPDANAHARQSQATSGDASAALRVQSLTLRGGQLREAGRYQVALPLLQEALALAEGAFGPDSLEAAAVLDQLGMLGRADGRFDEAEAAYRRALAIFEHAYGPGHYEVAVNLDNLAALCHANGRAEEAERLYLRALAVFERTLSPSHPKLVTCRENYERLLRELKGRL